ncbi:MAG TPA: RNA ligase, partial [Anaerolineales bacterium]|nr:RNA ligase [Anaerolineales bacterium]
GRKATGHLVTVTEKMDGSLGILYRTPEGYRVATRGAFHSPQAEWATRYLNETYDLTDLPNELTLLFEIIYPENRVIVDYHGQESLVLLAARNRFTGDYLPFFPGMYELSQQYGFPLPQTYYFNNVSEIIARAGALDESEEGFVLEFSDGQRFKIKGDKYLELHKLVFSLSFKNTLEAYQSGTVDYIRSQIPDEFLAEFNGWVNEIETTLAQTQAAIQAAFAAAPKTTRREYALWVRENQLELSPYLFAKIDGKPLLPMIYKLAFQNRGDDRVVKFSENTA